MGSHPHTKPTHSGPKSMPIMIAINKWADELPGFTDMFDEDSFYIFAGVFTLLTCLATVIASRYINNNTAISLTTIYFSYLVYTIF